MFELCRLKIGYHCSLFYPIRFIESVVHKLNVLPLCCLLAKYICFQITLFSFQGAALWSSFPKIRFQYPASLLDTEIQPLFPQVRLWWAQVDSNHRPPAYQADALTGWAMSPFYGGDKRDRTADLLLARQALSQLSYTPVYLSLFKWVVRVPSKLNNVSSTHRISWP